MRKFVGLFLLLMLLAVPAFAQDYPKAELFGGYSFMRADTGVGTHYNANGWAAGLTGNANDWFGVAGYFSGHYKSGVKIYGFLFGPELSYRKNEKVRPFFHALFGGAHGSGGGGSDNAFAMAYGGGFDVKANDKVAIRVAQFDYVATRFGGVFEHNYAFSAGVVFRFGQ